MKHIEPGQGSEAGQSFDKALLSEVEELLFDRLRANGPGFIGEPIVNHKTNDLSHMKQRGISIDVLNELIAHWAEVEPGSTRALRIRSLGG